jgi:putative ABC transport system ATP-binding protein
LSGEGNASVNAAAGAEVPGLSAAGAGAAGEGPAVGAEVRAESLAKTFGGVAALRDASLHVRPGEAVAITGRSGSGKSTFLALIGGLERPDRGRVLIDGAPLWLAPDVARARREVVGFVFQRHLLLESLTARANVEVPLIGARVHRGARRRRALELLGEVGLADRADHLPSELSGGERQRVAVARALVNQPRLLLADEPTGALDSVTSERVLDLLFRLRDQHGTTMIVVSYDLAVGARADRTVTLLDGELADVDMGSGGEVAAGSDGAAAAGSGQGVAARSAGGAASSSVGS